MFVNIRGAYFIISRHHWGELGQLVAVGHKAAAVDWETQLDVAVAVAGAAVDDYALEADRLAGARDEVADCLFFAFSKYGPR